MVIFWIIYFLVASYFIYDVYRSVSITDSLKDQIFHYTFAIIWPVALIMGIVLIAFDRLKDGTKNV